MPPIEEVDLHQKALVWPYAGFDRYSQPKVSAPVDIDCRWDSKRRQMVDSKGNKVGVDATVVVLDPVDIGSTIWLAPDSSYDASEQWYGTGSAGEDSGVMEVIVCNETPDMRNRVTRVTLGLVFYRDTPPESE